MTTHNKRHPQQAFSAFFVIFFHAFIIGFAIQALIPFYWIDDLSTNANLSNFAILSGLYSCFLAIPSSFKIYKSGALQLKYMLHITLYSVFIIVLAQTIFSISSPTENASALDIQHFIRLFAYTLIAVIIMAFISWNIWDKWRQTKTYDKD